MVTGCSNQEGEMVLEQKGFRGGNLEGFRNTSLGGYGGTSAERNCPEKKLEFQTIVTRKVRKMIRNAPEYLKLCSVA